MNLRHVVVTSVDRDDLPDLGAHHWAATISALRNALPETSIEVLIPDFQGIDKLINIVLASHPDIVGHNVETVRRLTPSFVREHAMMSAWQSFNTSVCKGLSPNPDLCWDWENHTQRSSTPCAT